ncbi:LOW QUALITY PROTEIN: uncharacterized protein [Anomalospiza imberbis]|uniref:LOW QUALITY PROTEIN: uncharacterized protein n=1 Tax=Anomalospiza imberbis TaxID=187417 RepID=UPI00358F9EF5
MAAEGGEGGAGGAGAGGAGAAGQRGGGEELLAAALAAWGEGRGAWGGRGGTGGEWGMGAGGAGDGSWGGGFVNGERGNGAGLVGGGRGKGAGLVNGGAGFVNGEGAGVPSEGGGAGNWGSGVLNGSSRVTSGAPWAGIGGPWAGTGGPGAGIGGPWAGTGGPGAGIGNPGGVIGGPGGVIGGPGAGIGGPGGVIGGPGAVIGGPGGVIGGPGAGIGGPGVGIGGPGGVIGGPGAGIGRPGGVIGGPGGVIGGPGVGIGGPGAGIGGPGVGTGGPQAPPGCLGLLSGGSGELPAAPWGSPRTPKVLLAPPPCSPPAPFLLILVPSAPQHLQRRLAVRDTWGGPWGHSRGGSGAPPARTVFVLGTAPEPGAQRELLAEWRRHGDILQGDFGDTYGNLTRKTLLLLRWARACCAAAPFLLKADDDVFVNVPAVATYLAAWPPAPPPLLYVGRVHWRVAPNRDPRSRHHVPAGLYPAAAFPPYCSGTAYALSRRAAAALLAAGRAVPLALPEDVWVGVAAERAGVAARHSARFGGAARVPPERCCAGRALFSAHRLRPAELRRVWAALAAGPGGCAGLGGALGLLRCRLLALREWLWGTAGE